MMRVILLIPYRESLRADPEEKSGPRAAAKFANTDSLKVLDLIAPNREGPLFQLIHKGIRTTDPNLSKGFRRACPKKPGLLSSFDRAVKEVRQTVWKLAAV